MPCYAQRGIAVKTSTSHLLFPDDHPTRCK